MSTDAEQRSDAPQQTDCETRTIGSNGAALGDTSLAAKLARAQLVPGTLYLVATPIGNLEDLSFRAVRVLREVDVIAAEDTRSAQTLLSRLGFSKPLVSYFEGNEKKRTDQLVERLTEKQTVALVTEAGAPAISDPGFTLVRRCHELGLPVDSIPGPSAPINALLLSGLPCDRFTFVGFLARSGRSRKEALEAIVETPHSVVFFESPRRLGATLAKLAEGLGQRQVAVLREMTKRHQQRLIGTAASLASQLDTPPKGEITVVIGPLVDEAGNPLSTSSRRQGPLSGAALVELEGAIRSSLQQGQSPKQIATEYAQRGYRRRDVYQTALRLKGEGSENG
jgi:16S rRNA (cytidine1402-2'-O)-methyltransferase